MTFLKANWRPIALGLGLLAAWLLLRTPAAALDSIADLDARLARGEPVVLEFFTNT